MHNTMLDLHIFLDAVKMYLFMRILKKALPNDSSMWVVFVSAFQVKQKYVTVINNFNDIFMVITCLWAIYLLISKNDLSNTRHLCSIFLLSLGINFKMSAILMLPGYLLVHAFKNGLASTIMCFV